MLIEILLKKCDKNKCDPFIVEVWLVEILLKKVRHELVWPILLGRFDRGSHFLMSHFLGWWTARRHGGVGVGVWLVGDGVVGVRRWKGWLGFGQGDLDVLWIIGLVGKKNRHESFVNRLTYGCKPVKIMAEMEFLRKRYMEQSCHMIGPHHYQAKLGRGWGRPLHFLHRPSPTPCPASLNSSVALSCGT